MHYDEPDLFSCYSLVDALRERKWMGTRRPVHRKGLILCFCLYHAAY